MPINIKLENERQEPIAELISPASLTNWMLSCSDLTPTKCLRFIDFYGNTVFNRYQMKILIEELNTVRATVSDASVEEAHKKWLAKFDQLDTSIQTYVSRYKKPNVPDIRRHCTAIHELAEEGIRVHHRYLRFVGD